MASKLTAEQLRSAALSLKRSWAGTKAEGRPVTDGNSYFEGYHDAIRTLMRLAREREVADTVATQ